MSRRAVRIGVVVVAAIAVLGVAWVKRPPESTDERYCGAAAERHELDPVQVADAPVPATAVLRAEVAQAVAATESTAGDLYVVAKGGGLWLAPAGTTEVEQVLDLSGELDLDSLEQGLLGVAVAPDGAHLYLYGTFTPSKDVIVEYALTGGRPDPASRRDVLVLDDPGVAHNGGRIAFGPDGMLYLGIGDGGDGALSGAAQDLGSPFGKLLRIAPTPGGPEPYAIPSDNPFVDDPDARGEVWAYGFRNPWGWSIDPETGDLWVGDVGQICFEEVDRAADGGRGVNFGWSYEEGSHEFTGPALGAGGVPDEAIELPDLGPPPDDLQGPLLERHHDEANCSVIGGFTYRGELFPALDGAYLFSDLCGGAIETLTPDAGGWILGRIEATPTPAGIVSIVPSRAGEILVLAFDAGVYELEPRS